MTVHGWQDNAGSFDALIPLLPTHLSYLVIDLPGHGHSSRLPSGVLYSSAIELYIINYIITQHFKWKQVSFMGHSLGSINCCIYATAFPGQVDMIVALDGLNPRVISESYVMEQLKGINSVYISDKRNLENSEPPSYSYDQLLNILEAQYFSVARENAPLFLKRAVKESKSHKDKYYFARDNKLKTLYFAMYSQDVWLQMATVIKCPVLAIKALDAPFVDKIEYFKETVTLMKNHNTQFEYVGVNGNHHVHLNNPKAVSGVISDFLQKHRAVSVASKL